MITLATKEINMKYWLIFMIFSDDGGEYLRKKEIPTVSREACEREAGRQARRMVTKWYLTHGALVTTIIAAAAMIAVFLSAGNFF